MTKKITKYNNKISKKSKFHDLYMQDYPNEYEKEETIKHVLNINSKVYANYKSEFHKNLKEQLGLSTKQEILKSKNLKEKFINSFLGANVRNNMDIEENGFKDEKVRAKYSTDNTQMVLGVLFKDD